MSKPVTSNTKKYSPAKALAIRKKITNLNDQAELAFKSVEISKKEAARIKTQLKKDLDNMSKMGEMEKLRLQMAMDRVSKMMSVLSNLLKKISDTASTISQNLK